MFVGLSANCGYQTLNLAIISSFVIIKNPSCDGFSLALNSSNIIFQVFFSVANESNRCHFFAWVTRMCRFDSRLVLTSKLAVKSFTVLVDHSITIHKRHDAEHKDFHIVGSPFDNVIIRHYNKINKSVFLIYALYLSTLFL